MSWPPPQHGGAAPPGPGEGRDGNRANRTATTGTYRDYLLARNSNSVFAGYLTGGSSEPSAPSLSLGERVVWLQEEGAAELGSVRWIGRLPSLEPKDWSVGVEFDRPIGNGNGRYAGKQYFIARNNHALFMPILTLMKAEEFFGGRRYVARTFNPPSIPPNDVHRGHLTSRGSFQESKPSFNVERPSCGVGGAVASPACVCPVHSTDNSSVTGPRREGQPCFLTSTPRAQRHRTLTVRSGGHRLDDWSDDDFQCQSWTSSQSVVSCPPALGPGTILMEVTSDSSDSDTDKGKFRTLMACFLPGMSRKKKKRKARKKRKKFVLTTQHQKQYSFVDGNAIRNSESCSAFSSAQCRVHPFSAEEPRRNVSCSVLDNFNTSPQHVRCNCSASTNTEKFRFSSPEREKAEKVRFSSSESERTERVRFLNPDSNSTSKVKKKKKAPLPPPRSGSPLTPKLLNRAFPNTADVTKSSISLTSNRTTSFNSLPMRDHIGNPISRSYLASMNSPQTTIPRPKVPPEDDPSYTGNLVLIGNQRPLSKLYQTKSLSALQKSEQPKLPNKTTNTMSQDLITNTGTGMPKISPHPRRKKKAPMPPAQEEASTSSSPGLLVPQLTVTSPELKRPGSGLSVQSRTLDVSTDDDRVDTPPALPKKTVSHDSLAMFGYNSESLKKKVNVESKEARTQESPIELNIARETLKDQASCDAVTVQVTAISQEGNQPKPGSPKATMKEMKDGETQMSEDKPKLEDLPAGPSKPKDSGETSESGKKLEGCKAKKKSKKEKQEDLSKEQNQVKEILSEIEQVVNSNPTVRDFVTAFNRFTEKAEKIAADYNTEVENMNPKPKPDPPKKITIKPVVPKETQSSDIILKSHPTKWTFNQLESNRRLNISFAEADQILKENELKQQEFEKIEPKIANAKTDDQEDKITNRRKSTKKYAAPTVPTPDPPSSAGSPKLNNLDAGPSTSKRYTSGVNHRGGTAAQPAAPTFSQNRDTLRQLAAFQRCHRRAISVGDLSQVNGKANSHGDLGRWPSFRPKTPDSPFRNGPIGSQCVGKPPLPLRALELSGGSPALFLGLEEAIARGDHKRAAALARELALHKVLQAKPKKNSFLSRKLPEEHLVTVSLYVEDKNTHQGPIPFTVYPSMSVAILKQKVERDLDFPVRCQRWILGQTFVMDDTQTLGSLDVCSPGCPVFLYVVQKKAQEEEEEQMEDNAANQRTKKVEERRPPDGVSPPKAPSPATSPVRSPLLLEAQLETLLEEAAADLSATLPVDDADTSSENSVPGVMEVWSAGSPELVTSFSPTDADDDEDEEENPLLLGPTPKPSPEPWTTEEGQGSRPPSRPSSAVARMSYDKLVALEDQDLIPNAETFECPVCFTLVEIEQGIVLRECLHQFCRECLSRAVEYSEEAVTKCPFMNEEYSCESHLLEREIKALVPPEVFEKHLQRSVAAAESRAENSFHCKSADCPGWCLYEDNVNVFACPVCACVNCLTCAAIHEGKDCRQYQDELDYESAQSEDARKTKEYLDSMVAEGKAMHCPTCRVIVMKKWGCDWLKCSVCQTEICWVTKGPRWGPAGRGDTSGGCQCMVNKVRCHPACNYCH